MTRRLLASLTLLLAPVALAVVWLAVHADLPDPIARHWDLHGRPNGFSSPGPYVGWTLAVTGLTAVLGIAVVVVGRRLSGVRVLAGILGGAAWLIAASTVDTLLSARGVADPHDIRSGGWHTALVLAVALAAGLLAGWLAPPGESRLAGAIPPPSYRLAEGERAVWVGSASSPALLWLGLAVTAAGAVVLLLAGWLWAIAILVAGPAVAAVHRVDVRIDSDGVLARFGALPWPVVRTPIGRIGGARAEQIEPMRWGGWGYRLSARGTALVVRRGPGLVIARTSGSDLAITVDRPEPAADLINALVARRTDT